MLLSIILIVLSTNGKDTSHDTVDIIYQFYSENYEESDNDSSSGSYLYADDDERLPRKRRHFEAPTEDITPFIKTPFTSMTFLPTETITETIDGCHSAKMIAMDKDLIWSMSLSRVDSVPMWLGYNCKICNDHSKIQTVEYLLPINDSPTSLAVVQETLNIAKKVAKNCSQEQIIATYDLAIAKLAMQIQYTR